MKYKSHKIFNFNSLSKFWVVSGIGILVSGCTAHNMDYRVTCNAHGPRNVCADSGYEQYSCRQEDNVIQMCAGFVDREVKKLQRSEASPDIEKENKRIDYEVRNTKPIFVGSSQGRAYVWVRGDGESQYVNTARLVSGVVEDSIKNYDMAVLRYFHNSKNRVIQDQSEVFDAIKKIENLSMKLDQVVDLGSPFLNSLPQANVGQGYESLALQVVNRVNPNDAYLKKAAEFAIAEQKKKEEMSNRRGLSSRGGARGVINELHTLKARLDLDYRSNFIAADLKMKEEMRATENKRLQSERNRLNRDNNKTALERNDSEKSMACKMSPELCN